MEIFAWNLFFHTFTVRLRPQKQDLRILLPIELTTTFPSIMKFRSENNVTKAKVGRSKIDFSHVKISGYTV